MHHMPLIFGYCCVKKHEETLSLTPAGQTGHSWPPGPRTADTGYVWLRVSHCRCSRGSPLSAVPSSPAQSFPSPVVNPTVFPTPNEDVAPVLLHFGQRSSFGGQPTVVVFLIAVGPESGSQHVVRIIGHVNTDFDMSGCVFHVGGLSVSIRR